MKLILTIIIALTGSSSIPVYAQHAEKYADVLKHYGKTGADSLKHKAALFLIENMDGHMSPEGAGIDDYARRIRELEIPCAVRTLSSAWNNARKLGETILTPDSTMIDCKRMIDDIDIAFSNWETAPWADDISFEQFCRYILPYRAKDERLCHGWRQALRNIYLPIIAGATDMKEAFVKVCHHINNTIRQTDPSCPYTMDVMTIDHLKQASCEQRCVLLASVLRSLAIPAAVDVVPLWANYSQMGHTWVSLVMGDGATYTVFEKEKEAKRYNKIDASIFPVRYNITPQDDCPFEVHSEKKVPKVYRLGYEHTSDITPDMPKPLDDRFASDVSAEYGLNSEWSIEATDTLPVYLCVFRSGADWTPVAYSKPRNGFASFKSLGHDIVYIAANIHANRLTAISAPFLLSEDGSIRTFAVDERKTDTVVLRRKYPLFSYMTNQWGNMKGGTFEGANRADFSDAHTLACIEKIPFGNTEIHVQDTGRYRFLRYLAPSASRTPMAEIAFFSTDKDGKEHRLTGIPIAHKIEQAKAALAFDGKTETVASTKSEDYWLGLDLGETAADNISKILFMPKSDANNVEQGHLYELYYFDCQWHLIGRRIAKGDNVTFGAVPANAILLLKDKTKGREERIFEYKENRQIWY